MSFHDDESSDLGPAGQSKLESFLFSKSPFTVFYQFACFGAHVGLSWDAPSAEPALISPECLCSSEPVQELYMKFKHCK